MLPELVEDRLASVGRDTEESNAGMLGEQAFPHCRQLRVLETHHDDVGPRRVDELRQVDVADGFAHELDALFGIETPANDVAENARQIDDQDSLITQRRPCSLERRRAVCMRGDGVDNRPPGRTSIQARTRRTLKPSRTVDEPIRDEVLALIETRSPRGLVSRSSSPTEFGEIQSFNCSRRRELGGRREAVRDAERSPISTLDGRGLKARNQRRGELRLSALELRKGLK